MTVRRASILLPCERLERFPTHLASEEAAGLLAGWTALWHPAIVSITGRLPGWHPADHPPDPSALEGELVVIPEVSRKRLASDWCERVCATIPANQPPVEALVSRDETIVAVLEAAGISPKLAAPCLVHDFLALGYAHLQVELLTRAMHYTTVLDTEQFSGAVVTAAHAAIAGNEQTTRDELGRAFDLLADARNHVYSVDFYVVEITLLADSTLGDALRSRLACATPTNLLVSGELIARMASEHPATLNELRKAVDAGTVCLIGGLFRDSLSGWESPEALLTELEQGQQIIRHHLGRECQYFGQYRSSFTLLLLQVLSKLGFKAALHAAFDGGRLPRASQCKTRWGEQEGPWLDALSATPLDAALPETWLKFAEHVGDSIARDHVATVLLAGWPGGQCDYHGDLQRAAHYNPVLGKLVTLEDYFRDTRETDEWTTFSPQEYPAREISDVAKNPISAHVDAYRRDALAVHDRLANGLISLRASSDSPVAVGESHSLAVLNPWNFAATRFVGFDPLERSHANDKPAAAERPPLFLPDVPACGYALREAQPKHDGVSLVEGQTLRNELVELTVSGTTGGIQSLRTHRDRSTRVSQRLVFHRNRIGRDPSTLDTQMAIERLEVTQNCPIVGEITTYGRLLDPAGQLLARFTQAVRLVRNLPVAFVDVQLEPDRLPEGDAWACYFASRLAWLDEAVSFRCGTQWVARETARERFETPEWVEISNGVGNIVCFGLGMPFHRRLGTTRLDTLLTVAGQEENRFQLAIGLDCTYPTQTSLGLLTARAAELLTLPRTFVQPRGWFLHLSARNLLITHLEALDGDRSGIRCRILETEGRSIDATLTAYRPFHAARVTDFRGNTYEVSSVVDGVVRFDIGPHRWTQLEAEW
jgi:alpha-mannosidase